MLILSTLLLAMTPVQEPVAADAGSPVLVTTGSVAVPDQPTRRSRSRYIRTPRRRMQPLPTTTNRRLTAPVSSICSVRGMEKNTVIGIGLVTGLANTGDSGDAAVRFAQNTLTQYGFPVELSGLSGNNIALVRVEGEIAAGAKPGTLINLRVSTWGDAKSLVGGQLMPTELFDARLGTVYATASGSVTVGGASASGEAATAVKNHTTVGTMENGGKVEREIPTVIVNEDGILYLDAKRGQDTFANMVSVKEAANRLFPNVAQILPDGKSIRVAVPADLLSEDHIAYINALMNLEVDVQNLARVIINERTGVVVMGGDVRLHPGVVAAGNITVTIAETTEASQPGAFSQGETVRLPRTDLTVIEEDRALTLLPQATTLTEVMDVLNILGATPRDLISILTALSEAGLLVADIQRM